MMSPLEQSSFLLYTQVSAEQLNIGIVLSSFDLFLDMRALINLFCKMIRAINLSAHYDSISEKVCFMLQMKK